MNIRASQAMRARLVVYESEVAWVRLNQFVVLWSENEGFEGDGKGRVLKNSSLLMQRGVLPTDPTGDVDARVIKVDVELNAESQQLVCFAG